VARRAKPRVSWSTALQAFLAVLPTFLGSSGLPPVIRDIGVCLLIAGVLSAVFTRLKIPTIAAFLAGGVLVGPVAGGFVTDRASIDTIASLGLILLLFLIGLEIDVRKLAASGKTLILSGLLQFPLCVAFGAACTFAIQATGWDAFGGKYTPLYLGVMLAASSTLIAVKLFQERMQLDTLVGRVSLGVLIFQDIWSIVVLAVQPNFNDPKVAVILLSFADIAIITTVAVLGAKYVLPRVFRWIAKTPELMLVVATAWCFGIAFLGNNLGHLLEYVGIHLEMTVSMEMGALIAGASIAALPYSTEVVAKVSNVRDFFVTLFFVGLGMGIPSPEGVEVILMALLLTVLAVASRYLVFFPLFYFTGMDRRNAIVGATRLMPISEFCLVIVYMGASLGHVSAEFGSACIFAFVITALASPPLFDFGDKLHDKFGGLLGKIGFKPPQSVTKMLGGHGHGADIVLLGFHRVASSLLYHVERKQPELLPHMMVVDFNVSIHKKIAERGVQVRYGDVSNLETLHHAGVPEAKIIVCTIPDDLLKGTSNLKLLKALKQMNPKAKVIVTALTMADGKEMYAAGADYVSMPRIEVAESLVPVVEAAMTDSMPSYRSARHARVEDPLDRAEVIP
jgi:Kef-type K+ transport system membrane component KefB